MKKVISLKEVMIIFLSVVLITISTTVSASDIVLGNGNNTATPISGNEYENAQTPETDNASANNTTNNTANNATNNTANNTSNKAKTYNTNNTNDLPQTGIEDYNVGILLIICIASAIFAYKKIRDYKNV